MRAAVSFAVTVVFLSAGICFAQEEPVKPETEQAAPEPSVPAAPEAKAEEKTISEMKEITGEISGISGSFIAITHGVSPDSEALLETAFNVGKDVRIIHKRSLKDLKQGDTVTARFEELTQTFADGRKLRRNTLKSITFLKSAPKEMKSAALTTPDESASDLLSLKGTKGR